MHPDFVDLLRAFLDANVRFLVVGAHAVAAHARPRATGDLDVWVDATPENAARVFAALARFGAPMERMMVSDFTDPDLIFQIGVAPLRIDILTSITGVPTFEESFARSVRVTVENLTVPVLGRKDLIANKRAVARPKDLADLARLEAPWRPR